MSRHRRGRTRISYLVSGISCLEGARARTEGRRVSGGETAGWWLETAAGRPQEEQTPNTKHPTLEEGSSGLSVLWWRHHPRPPGTLSPDPWHFRFGPIAWDSKRAPSRRTVAWLWGGCPAVAALTVIGPTSSAYARPPTMLLVESDKCPTPARFGRA